MFQMFQFQYSLIFLKQNTQPKIKMIYKKQPLNLVCASCFC